MEKAKPFYDLCIHSKLAANFDPFAKKCVEFGYKTIAIDHVLDLSNIDEINERKKKNKKVDEKDQPDYVRPPIQVLHKDFDLTVLSRLTLICNSKDILIKVMHHKNFQHYDIFAICAKNTDMFQIACALDPDIITFDPLDVKGVKFSRKLYKKNVSNGTYFELMYYPAIIDQTARRNIISRSHVYHQVGRSENIIITSKCNSVTTLRGPYDVINLGLILGLNEHQSKHSITTAGADVLQHAMSRKIGKAIVHVTSNGIKAKNNEYTMEVDDDETNDLVGPMQKRLKKNENDVILLDS